MTSKIGNSILNLARTFDEWLWVWMDEWESCNEQESLCHVNKNLLWSEKRTSVMVWVWLTFVISCLRWTYVVICHEQHCMLLQSFVIFHLRWTYVVICHEQHCMLLQSSIISIRTVLHVAVPSEWMKRWSRKRNCSTKWKWK